MVLNDAKNRPQCPKSNSDIKITVIPISQNCKENLNLKCTKEVEENEKDDLKDSFAKLTICADNYGLVDLCSLNNLNYRNVSSKCDSDSESSSCSDSASDDEDIVAKGVEEKGKKYKENRSVPYPIEYNNRNHCSGGILLVDQCPLYNSFNNLQAPQNIHPEERYNENIDKLIAEINDKLSADDIKKVDSVIQSILDCKSINNLESPLEDVESINNGPMIISEKETIVNRNIVDDDSAYETSSPHSSISNSPMPNPYSNYECSPSHDSQSAYNINFPEFGELKTPQNFQQNFKVPSPRPIESREKTQPLNIPFGKAVFRMPTPPQVAPVNIYLPVPPSSPHNIQQQSRLPSLAPESVEVVHEEEMKISAEIRIKKKINVNKMDIQWIKVLLDKEFFQVDLEEDTKVMKHLKSKDNPKIFYEILLAHLERIKQENENGLKFLKSINRKGESALSIALFSCTDKPLVARYIIETLKYFKDDVDMVDLNSNSLIHRLVLKGDKFAKILAELLNTKCFDVNKKNHLLQTPLHIAVQAHKRLSKNEFFSTLVVSKLLINHNASVLIGDSNGMTPIHTLVKNSCDPQLLKALLSHKDILHNKFVDIKTDHYGNTALHDAANRNDLPIELQAKIMKQLKDCSWSLTTKNLNDKTPLSLISEDRKQWILEYINTK